MGKRKPRAFENRSEKLGYYIIYTDTKKTERNYINGYYKSLPIEFQEKIEIQIKKDETINLIEACLQYQKRNPQYSSAWIIFDKDKNENFNQIIENANQKGIQVAWSNPCIEIWFSGYFGKMHCIDSVTCCSNFSELYKNKTGLNYSKNDDSIYTILNKFGDEKQAIKYFKKKHENAIKCGIKPDDQVGGSCIFLLLEEINKKMT